MKQQSLSISIPEPCHEKWSEMTPAEKGRHCKSCQKTVVDFTAMPKVKIAEFVTENKGNLCGRFSSDQLNVELIPPKPSKSWLKYAAIILGLIPTIGYGQEVANKNNLTTTPTSINLETIVNVNHKKGEVSITKSSKQNITSKLSGFVSDNEIGETLLFAKVVIYRDEKLFTSIETDLDGRFTIEAQEGDFIEASYPGYIPTKVKLENIDFNKDLILNLEVSYALGDFVVTEYRTTTHKENADEKNIETKKVIGKIIDAYTGFGVPFGTIAYYIEDELILGVETDVDGRFEIEIPKGSQLELSSLFNIPKLINYNDIPNGEELNIVLEEKILQASEFIVGHVIEDIPIAEEETPAINEYPEPEITITGSSFTITGMVEKQESTLRSKQIQTSKLSGLVLDKQTGEEIIFGTVAIYRDDELYTGAETDINGRFTIEAQEGDYIEASYIGYTPVKIKLEDIDFSKDFILYIEEGVVSNCDGLVGCYSIPMEREETLHYQFPTVEITTMSYDVYTKVMGSYATVSSSIGIISVKRENWFKRVWKKFEALVTTSHEEAQKNKSIQSENNVPLAQNTESSVTQETTVKSKDSHKVEPNSIQSKVNIFPNPSDGIFHIQLPNKVENFQIEISNIQNELLVRLDQHSFDGSVDLSMYPAGSYVVAVIVDGDLVNSQVVIKM